MPLGCVLQTFLRSKSTACGSMNEKEFYRYEGKYFRENEPRLISRGCTIHTKKVTMSDSSRFSADGRAGE